jgi:hypothetical protein
VNVNDALGRRHEHSFGAEDRVGDEAEGREKPPQETFTETAAARAEVSSLFFTRQDVLAALASLSGKRSISRKTLERLEQRGEGPPKTVLPGRLVVYRKDSFHEWLRGFERTPHRARRSRRTS